MSGLLPQQSYQISQQLLEEEFQRERARREELHQLEVQERRARLQREAIADERAAAAAAQPPPRVTAVADEVGEATLTEPLTFKVPASFRGKVNAPDNLYATLLWERPSRQHTEAISITYQVVRILNFDTAFKVAFVGFFRLGEIVYSTAETRNTTTFQATKLTRQDVRFFNKGQYVTIRLKRSKSDHDHRGITVVVRASRSSPS
jgi:hypothetical protein